MPISYGEVDQRRLAGLSRVLAAGVQQSEQQAMLEHQRMVEKDYAQKAQNAALAFGEATRIAEKNPLVANQRVAALAAGLSAQRDPRLQKMGQEFSQRKFQVVNRVQKRDTIKTEGYTDVERLSFGPSAEDITSVTEVGGKKLTPSEDKELNRAIGLLGTTDLTPESVKALNTWVEKRKGGDKATPFPALNKMKESAGGDGKDAKGIIERKVIFFKPDGTSTTSEYKGTPEQVAEQMSSRLAALDAYATELDEPSRLVWRNFTSGKLGINDLPQKVGDDTLPIGLQVAASEYTELRSQLESLYSRKPKETPGRTKTPTTNNPNDFSDIFK